MPAVASISIEYGSFSSFTQTPPNNGLYINPVNSRTLAQYALYNRDFPDENFKLSDNEYLSYVGGFLTEEDKINFKNSDFILRNTTNQQGGNLYVSGTSKFFSNINVADIDGNSKNNIRNVRRIKDVGDLRVTTYDTDAMTVGDFKNYLYQPGMIVYYKGTLDSIRANLPFWRVCAPPDAGQTFTTPAGQTVTVPNLFSKFIPAAQPTDVTPPGNSYKTTETGGYDAIKLSVEEMPKHNHNIILRISGDEDPQLGGIQTFRKSGGTITQEYSRARACSYKGASCTCGMEHIGKKRHCWDGGVTGISEICASTVTCKRTGPFISFVNAVDVTSVTGISITGYLHRVIKNKPFPAKIVRQGELFKGSSLSHENRPMFYTLIPIIYVGKGAQ
jgi:hypothetical protein